MKIQLFDDEDLKRIEDTFARALVRALRTVMKEGLIAGYTPPKPEAFADAAPKPPEPPAAPLAPTRPTWAQPSAQPPAESEPPKQPESEPKEMFGMRVGEPQSGHGYRQTHPIARALNGQPTRPPLPPQPTRWTAREACPSVNKRPEGFVTTDEAAKLIDLEYASAKTSIHQWIRAGSIEGVIWCNSGMTPTKGLPGRLMVKKEDVVRRNEQRAANRAAMEATGKAGAHRWSKPT